MCIRVCIHRTSAEHDKRFCAVLNPATGYTVLSPFQDPVIDFCELPCVEHPNTSFCPWHLGCCIFDEYNLCRDPQSCNLSVNYHHFLNKEAPSFSVGVLRTYMVDSTFPSYAARFFKAGVELKLALAKIPELQSSLDRLRKLGLSDGVTAINKAEIASRWYHYQHIKLVSGAFLAQMAIYWDMKSESGLWPHRPGREVLPDLNVFNDSDAHLKGVSVGNMDLDPRGQWPHIFKQTPNFVESLSYNDNPNLLPWARDPTSGEWKSVTDVSYSTYTQVSDTRMRSVTEPVSINPAQLDRRRPESGSRSKQQHDKDSKHDNHQGSISHQCSPRAHTSGSPTPASSDSSSSEPPGPHHRKPSRNDQKRIYRHFHRHSKSVTSRRNLKKRSHSYRSNKQVSSKPISSSIRAQI